MKDRSFSETLGTEEMLIALAGNPNVGKSTVFNALTGMRQHTGNWTGKTVSVAYGKRKHRQNRLLLADLPGTYSLDPHSAEEEITRDFLIREHPHCVIAVADATCLERSLILILQLTAIAPNTVVCLNLTDEARKKGITVDTDELSLQLGVPVIAVCARKKTGLTELLEAACNVANGTQKTVIPPLPETEHATIRRAEEIAKRCVCRSRDDQKDLRIDRIVTSRLFGIPLMILLLMLILWITVRGANLPSELLSQFFAWLGTHLRTLASPLPQPITALLFDGIYNTLTWVIAVMLPPMAIFFPLFTFLEDIGYLPRVAFNLDTCFRRAHAHGKQALTMCMGFGCNACGVIGCRILDTHRERSIAMLTNSFVPCNGKFPTLILLITVFFANGSPFLGTLLLTAAILLSIFATFAVSRFLSATLFRGISSSFVLELPPYRSPQIGKILIRSLLDRTLFVLGRAAAIAAPAGLLLYLAANIPFGGTSVLLAVTDFLDPIGKLFGLDGVILTAFLLGLPANEIVLPIAVMCYTATGTLTPLGTDANVLALLTANGWTWKTALCVMIFTLFHFPCATTLRTFYKETGSFRQTVLAAILPTAVGLGFCLLVNLILKGVS